MTARPRYIPVHAPIWDRPAHAADDGRLIAGSSDERRRCGAILLRAELQRQSVVEPTTEEAAIHVRLLIAGVDVGSRFRRRVPHAPCPQIDADFVGRAF